jgi:hypothetical protein
MPDASRPADFHRLTEREIEIMHCNITRMKEMVKTKYTPPPDNIDVSPLADPRVGTIT